MFYSILLLSTSCLFQQILMSRLQADVLFLKPVVLLGVVRHACNPKRLMLRQEEDPEPRRRGIYRQMGVGHGLEWDSQQTLLVRPKALPDLFMCV